MITINETIAKELIKINKTIGRVSVVCAFIRDSEFIIVYKGNNIFLAHRSEFIFDGIQVKLRGA